MKQLHTEVEINASVEGIWGILTDFKNYPDWNPFVLSVSGELEIGAKLTVRLHQPDSKPMTIQPSIIRLKKNVEWAWQGHLIFPGIFDGEHCFELEVLDNGKTRFAQKENFKGILVALLWKMLDTKTRKGFESMNRALKKRAEKSF